MTNQATAIVCDMTNAPDTEDERLDEYRRLFATALMGREKNGDRFRWRFRDDEGIEPWVRDLAAREQACCAFFSFTVTRSGGEVRLDGTVVDDDAARAVMEEFYNLPETLAEREITPVTLDERFTRHGLQVLRPAQ